MAEFIVYIITTAITPGPNCIISLSNASQKGFPKFISLNFGMLIGIAAVDSIAFLLVSFLVDLLPSIRFVFQIFGIIYLLFLSWCLLMHGKVSIGDSTGGFKTGFLMQFVNVKVLMLGVTSISVFVLPLMTSKLNGYLITMLVPVLCFFCGLVWAFAGVALSNIYNKKTKVFNVGFAAVLLIQALMNLVKLIKR